MDSTPTAAAQTAAQLQLGSISEFKRSLCGNTSRTREVAPSSAHQRASAAPHRERSAHAVGQVASPGACSAAARVSKARVRRRPARIPNPSLQPSDPDLATITRRPTLRQAPWSTLRQKRKRTYCREGGVAWCVLCGRARGQGSGLTPAGSDSEPEPPAPSPYPLATITRRPTLRSPPWSTLRRKRRRTHCREGVAAPGTCSAAARVSKARVRRGRRRLHRTRAAMGLTADAAGLRRAERGSSPATGGLKPT